MIVLWKKDKDTFKTSGVHSQGYPTSLCTLVAYIKLNKKHYYKER